MMETRTEPTPGFAPTRVPADAAELRVVEAGRIVLARLNGALDEHQGAALLRRLRPLARPSRRIVLDLRWTDFLDSGGVRALIDLQDEVQAASADLRLILNPRSSVSRTLALLKLQSHFRTYVDAAGAWYESGARP